VPHDENLVARVRDVLSDETGVVEKEMFGGLTFMLRGKMCCGVAGERLMVRVGPDWYDDALREYGAAPMDLTGKPLRGFVFVAPEACATESDLRDWVDRARQFTLSLPEK
jgi:TfoX/Sxy family transcriptional regulator of competence genes